MDNPRVFFFCCFVFLVSYNQMSINVVKIFGLSAFSPFSSDLFDAASHPLSLQIQDVERPSGQKLFPAAKPITSDCIKTKMSARRGWEESWCGSRSYNHSYFLRSVQIFPSDLNQKLNFLSRNQTWVPIFDADRRVVNRFSRRLACCFRLKVNIAAEGYVSPKEWGWSF